MRINGWSANFDDPIHGNWPNTIQFAAECGKSGRFIAISREFIQMMARDDDGNFGPPGEHFYLRPAVTIAMRNGNFYPIINEIQYGYSWPMLILIPFKIRSHLVTFLCVYQARCSSTIGPNIVTESSKSTATLPIQSTLSFISRKSRKF